MYPMQTLKDTIAFTNENLDRIRHRVIREGDWFTWIGLRLAMALEPRDGPTKTYWESETREGCVDTPLDFGRWFGMSRLCFEQIMQAMAFSDGRIDNDRW